MMVAQSNNISDTGEYQSTITRTIDQHETVFQADLDGDGLTTIETNGDFKIFGGSGNDTIYGGVGNDTLDGGTGSRHHYNWFMVRIKSTYVLVTAVTHYQTLT